MEISGMSDRDNELRLLAHEHIRLLYEHGAKEHINMLKMHCERAIEEIENKLSQNGGA